METGLARTLATGFLDALWPRSCFGCCRPLGRDCPYLHLCERCVGDFNFLLLSACPRCGCHKSQEGSGCAPCQRHNFSFCSCRSLFEFNGIGRELIHELKYRSGYFLLPDIGRLSRVSFSDLRGGILVPVPLHWRRRWRRGFNQSELICRAFAAEHGCRVRSLLRRKCYRRPQVGLDRAERRRNVEGVFTMVPRVLWKGIAKDAKIFLVDDVFTTGATVNECAKVLLREGFTNVHVRTLARG